MSKKVLIRKDGIEDILDLTGMQQGMLYYYLIHLYASLFIMYIITFFINITYENHFTYL